VQKRRMNSNGHAMMVALVISATREPLRGATEFCHWDFKALKKRPQIVKRTGLSAALLLVGHPIWGVGPGPLNSPIRFAIGRHADRKLLSPTHASGIHLCVASTKLLNKRDDLPSANCTSWELLCRAPRPEAEKV
jgi:hypothetical protein